TALLRQLDPDVDRTLRATRGSALVAAGKHEHADPGDRANLAQFHSLSSSNAVVRVCPGRPRSAPPPVPARPTLRPDDPAPDAASAVVHRACRRDEGASGGARRTTARQDSCG